MAGPPRPFHADDLFYRQIPQEFINLRKGRISAAAFQNSTGSNEMSVDWAWLTTAAQTMARRPERGVSQFAKQLCERPTSALSPRVRNGERLRRIRCARLS